MPISTLAVGQQTPPVVHDVDARWLMAYVAGLGDMNPRFMDTAAGPIVAHPLFPVCLEWPAILASRDLPGYEAMTDAERARGVHAAHDLHIYKPLVAGERYSTTATIAGVDVIKPGAAQTLRLDTHDNAGDLVCRTWQLSISRGVAVTQAESHSEGMIAPALPDLAALPAVPEENRAIEISAGLGNVYTECARIFNPIHSDRAFALAAGLPNIILHGTATLALGVSRLVNDELDGDASKVARIGGRFTGLVMMPSTLQLVVKGRSADMIGFVIRNAAGAEIFGEGYLGLR